jgi:hypothetical protein
MLTLHASRQRSGSTPWKAWNKHASAASREVDASPAQSKPRLVGGLSGSAHLPAISALARDAARAFFSSSPPMWFRRLSLEVLRARFADLLRAPVGEKRSGGRRRIPLSEHQLHGDFEETVDDGAAGGARQRHTSDLVEAREVAW